VTGDSLRVTDGDWRHRAGCLDTDPELFFPTGTTGPAEQQIQDAKAICALCPVQGECLEWALDTNQDAGVWGGVDEVERRAMRRRQRRKDPTSPIRHGTGRAYDADRCRCPQCREANAQRHRVYRPRKQTSA
jgi:WhiB family redox-sensing transcriptional regulator